MNSKKVNWIFLSIMLVHIGMVALIRQICMGFRIELGIVPNLLLSQGMILVPALFGVLFSGEDLFRLAGFRKIKVSTIFKTLLFTFLSMPLMTLLNAISLLFVDNTVAAMSGDVLGLPFPVMLFLIGIFGPCSEELVFRGIVYQGYRKNGTVFASMLLSALLFALMHMNFNQAFYAMAVGILVVLLVEATGSLWSSILFHVFFNSWQVCMMYLYGGTENGGLEEAQELLTTDMLLLVISFMLVVASVATALAVCVLVWIAKGEQREYALRAVWADRKKKKDLEEAEKKESAVRKNRMVTVPLIIGIVLALSFMGLELVLTYLFA